jgi:hypothetical protein
MFSLTNVIDAELPVKCEHSATSNDIAEVDSIVTTIKIPKSLFCMVAGTTRKLSTYGVGTAGFPKFNPIEAKHRVVIVGPSVPDRESFLMIEGPSQAAVDAARQDVLDAAAEALSIPTFAAHIAAAGGADGVSAAGDTILFVDNSNIRIGAQSFVPGSPLFPTGTPPGTVDRSIVVNIPVLASWLLNDRAVVHREVVGTMPPIIETMWKNSGFTVRTTEGDKPGHADEVLHAQILQRLQMHEPGTLVLATGDGNNNDGKSSFPGCVASALRHGWRVEVVCWKASGSSVYSFFRGVCPSRVSIRYLDADHGRLCFRPKPKPVPAHQVSPSYYSPPPPPTLDLFPPLPPSSRCAPNRRGK